MKKLNQCAIERNDCHLTIRPTDVGLFVNLSHCGAGVAMTLDVDEATKFHAALGQMLPELPKKVEPASVTVPRTKSKKRT